MIRHAAVWIVRELRSSAEAIALDNALPLDELELELDIAAVAGPSSPERDPTERWRASCESREIIYGTLGR